jgi:hypothetical protein
MKGVQNGAHEEYACSCWKASRDILPAGWRKMACCDLAVATCQAGLLYAKVQEEKLRLSYAGYEGLGVPSVEDVGGR